MTRKPSKIKRYNLSLPVTMFNDVVRVSKEEGTTMLEILRQCVKFGIYIHNLMQADPTTKIFILNRKTGEKKEIVVL